MSTITPPPDNLTHYTYAQLMDLWVWAGGDPFEAAMAAAVALAESGGDPQSMNDKNTDGSIDRGLWQINSSHGLQSTFDPYQNAQAAVSIANSRGPGTGANFHPWCTAWSDGACGTKGGTYTGKGSPFLQYIQNNSAYRGDYGKAPSGVGGVITDAGRGVSSAWKGFTSWTEALTHILSTLGNPRFWLRIGQGLASVVLLLISMGLIFRKDATALVKAGALAA